MFAVSGDGVAVWLASVVRPGVCGWNTATFGRRGPVGELTIFPTVACGDRAFKDVWPCDPSD